ncbi:MAG: transcriptional regulator [Chloroflexota bacterium]|nr:transcriptional regulator [Chloroflexota bacterium]
MSPTETSSADLRPIADIDRLVHEPARLMILAVLYVVESADFLFLMHQTRLTRGNLSSHMSKLEAAGYIDIKKEFVGKIPRTLLRLTDKGREAFQTYRQDMIQVLEHLAG